MARGWYSYVISQPILGIFFYHDEIVEKYTSGKLQLDKTAGFDWLMNDLIMRIRGRKLEA